MKKRQKATWFVSGVLCSAVMASTVIPSVAALMEQKLTVHTGVQVYVDDVKLDAGDTHGNPDAFIYNGTTYVAVAAVSKSLGEDVLWEGDTKSVYIGKHEGVSKNLLSVCPPYQTNNYNKFTTVEMSGVKYANGFSFGVGDALFNLNGKYDSLSFYIGHIDGGDMCAGALNIYLDNELAFSLDLDPYAMPDYYQVPLNGAIQMKIELDSGDWSWEHNYAMANVQVS